MKKDHKEKPLSLQKTVLKQHAVPVLLFLLCVLAYGLLIAGVGFYWDDWVFAWTARFLGPGEFIPSFLPFRPFLGPIFTLTTSLLGSLPLIWQIFGILVRFATGLVAYWSLGQIWPKAKLQVALAACFFVVFPGYNQQWVAFTHVNQELIPLIFYLLSLGMMVKAVRAKPVSLKITLLALLFTFLGLYPTEYFFGLELLRPLILWFVIREENSPARTTFSRFILRWIPYLALWISNALFLYMYHNSSFYESYGLGVISVSDTGVLSFIVETIETFIHAIVTTGFTAWVNTIGLLTNSLSVATTWVTLGLVGVSFGLVFLMLHKNSAATKTSDTQNPFGWQAILLGLLGIAAGRLPSWLGGLPLEIEFSWDRFMLSTMLGGSLLIIGLVDYLVQDRNRKLVVACVLIAFAVGWQFMKANTFRREWDNQRQLMWQLAWRVPDLKPGTLLVTHELPFTYVTDQSLTAPINWIYAPEIKTRELPYMLAYTKSRLNGNLLPGLQPGMPVSAKFRTMTFQSNTDSVLVIFQENPGCLRIMDAHYSSANTVPGVSYMLTDAIPLSNLDQIVSKRSQPNLPSSVFGKEPAHTWCYYFEKAELARQQNDWQEVVRLGDEADQKGFEALQPAENLVFIEGYGRAGQTERAMQISRTVAQQKPDLQPALCDVWHRIQASNSQLESSTSFLTEFQCN